MQATITGGADFDSILSGVGVRNGYVWVGANGPFLAYGVVNDGAVPGQGTGDGSYPNGPREVDRGGQGRKLPRLTARFVRSAVLALLAPLALGEAFGHVDGIEALSHGTQLFAPTPNHAPFIRSPSTRARHAPSRTRWRPPPQLSSWSRRRRAISRGARGARRTFSVLPGLSGR